MKRLFYLIVAVLIAASATMVSTTSVGSVVETYCSTSVQEIQYYFDSIGERKTIVSFEDIPFSNDKIAKDDQGNKYYMYLDSSCNIVGWEDLP